MNVPEDARWLSDVVCINTKRCIASGQSGDTRGLILLTTDGGFNWRIAESSRLVNLVEELACLSDETCIALASRLFGPDVVYLSQDGGETWSAVELEDGTNVEFAACGEGFCLGVGPYRDEPTLFKSTDGNTWLPIAGTHTLAEGTNEIECSSTSSYCWLTTRDPGGSFLQNRILLSEDQGITWNDRTPSARTGASEAIACPVRGNCWWAGVAFMASTKDSGKTWRVEQLGRQGIVGVSALACPDASLACYAASTAGVLAIAPEEEYRLVAALDERHSERLTGLDCSGTTCIGVGAESGEPLVLVRSAD